MMKKINLDVFSPVLALGAYNDNKTLKKILTTPIASAQSDNTRIMETTGGCRDTVGLGRVTFISLE